MLLVLERLGRKPHLAAEHFLADHPLSPALFGMLVHTCPAFLIGLKDAGAFPLGQFLRSAHAQFRSAL
jgi:hypothetical protein